MEWVQWAIPLFVAAVWILSNLVKTKNDEPRPRRQEETEPRRTPEEIDRFLEEVRRRKRTNEDQRGEKPLPNRAPPPSRTPPPERPRPVPPPMPPILQSPPEPPRRSPEPVRPSERRPMQAPTTTRRVEPSPLQMAEVIEVGVPALQPARASFPMMPAAGAPQRVAPAVALLKNMLSNRHNLAAAMLLKEILDPPVSRRKR